MGNAPHPASPCSATFSPAGEGPASPPLGERVARAKPEPGEGDTDPGKAQMRLPASRGVGYLKAVKIKGKNR